MGGGMNKKGEFRSQVPHVMLHLNPGVARHYGTQVKKLDLLKDKAERTAEQRRTLYIEKFEERRRHRDRLYGRLIKIDDETRRAVDKITLQRRQMKLEENRLRHERRTIPQNPDQESRQYEMPDSPTTAMNVAERPWDEDGFSRRSSLRSTSIYDFEGTRETGADSPGPEKTDNPWDSSVPASRRSSIGVKPELLVTTTAPDEGDDDRSSTAGGGEKMTMSRLMTLLPAPTPTRFIGKMHAVVAAKPNRQKEKPTEIPDTISENAEVEELNNKAGDARGRKGGRRGSKKNFAMASKIVGRFAGLTKQSSVASEVSEPSESSSAQPSKSKQEKREEWQKAAKKSIDLAPTSPSGSQISTDAPSQTSSTTKIKSMGGLMRKVSPKTGAAASAKSSAASAKGVTPPTSKKRGGGGIFASKLGKMRSDMSFGPSAQMGSNIRSLQSASMILGKFITAKASKKSEDEVLAGFGEEKDSSSDEELKLPALEKQSSKEEAAPANPFAMGKKKNLLGKIGKAASVAKSRLQSAASIDAESDAGGGAVSLTMLSKMAAFQKHTKLLIAAAYVGGQLAPWDQLTKTWMTGIPTSIRFLGRSCRVTPRGPGGLVVSSSPPPAGVDPDFSQTVNMLTLLSKADIKLKTAAIKESTESRSVSRVPSPSAATGGSQLAIKIKSRSASRTASPGSNDGSSTKIDDQKINNQLETEDSTKKLTESLIIVRPASIARWNEHKDVKEDKERDPYFFSPYNSEGRKKKEKQQEQIASAAGWDLHSTMLASMALKTFNKREN